MKTAIKSVGVAAVVVLLLAGISFSGHHGKGKTGYAHKTDKMNMDFKSIDSNSNGSLSFEEYKTAFPSSSQKGFNTLDTDGNEALSTEEWQKFKDMHTGMGGYHKKAYHDKNMADPGGYNAHFGDIDTNGDEQVTMSEFDAFFSDGKHKAQVFSSIDMDKSGTLDHDEWHQFKKAHNLKHQD